MPTKQPDEVTDAEIEEAALELAREIWTVILVARSPAKSSGLLGQAC